MMCEVFIDILMVFFFQAEDGIRDYKVTGVQTCALPISARIPLTPDENLVEAMGSSAAGDVGAIVSGAAPLRVLSPPMARRFHTYRRTPHDPGSSATSFAHPRGRTRPAMSG